jgi:hypothetical protein
MNHQQIGHQASDSLTKPAARSLDSSLPRGHVVFHHGAFLHVMPNRVHMVGAGRFEKLLKVIGGLPCLVLEVTFSSGNELLIGVIGLLVFATLVTAGGDCDSLGSLLWPPLVTFGAPLCALAGFLEGRPLTTIGAAFPLPWMKMAPTTSSPEACLVPMLSNSFVVFS